MDRLTEYASEMSSESTRFEGAVLGEPPPFSVRMMVHIRSYFGVRATTTIEVIVFTRVTTDNKQPAVGGTTATVYRSTTTTITTTTSLFFPSVG